MKKLINRRGRPAYGVGVYPLRMCHWRQLVAHSDGQLARRVDDEVTAEAQEHAVGSEELQPRLARLRDEEPVERVMSGELGVLANALSVLRRDAQQDQPLLGEPGRELVRNRQLAEHRLDCQLPDGGRRDVNRHRRHDDLPSTWSESRAVVEHP